MRSCPLSLIDCPYLHFVLDGQNGKAESGLQPLQHFFPCSTWQSRRKCQEKFTCPWSRLPSSEASHLGSKPDRVKDALRVFTSCCVRLFNSLISLSTFLLLSLFGLPTTTSFLRVSRAWGLLCRKCW